MLNFYNGLNVRLKLNHSIHQTCYYEYAAKKDNTSMVRFLSKGHYNEEISYSCWKCCESFDIGELLLELDGNNYMFNKVLNELDTDELNYNPDDEPDMARLAGFTAVGSMMYSKTHGIIPNSY
jgi:hypothetical protein